MGWWIAFAKSSRTKGIILQLMPALLTSGDLMANCGAGKVCEAVPWYWRAHSNGSPQKVWHRRIADRWPSLTFPSKGPLSLVPTTNGGNYIAIFSAQLK